ncbi:UDP-2,3-diacylglucosamine diphosphatase [Robiginitalea biformata]|uniref:UDP-2,3-diacylglucosamine diphosphatase n=1 Tax=Robiginitalea biformata TaxID=252307 RepID=UPI003B5BEAF2
MAKRDVELVVISDVHLGTYGCHATELLAYMKSIRPSRVILNGDIIDIWQFSKRYWPPAHMKVIRQLVDWVSRGVEVYYVTGNHDEMLRKFAGSSLGNFRVVNKVVLELDGRRAWFFHGDVFDITMQHSKWLARLGAIGYDALILLNRGVNYVSLNMGYGKLSMSKRIKNSVKSAIKFIDNFELTAAEIAVENAYDYVVCGHIHQPVIRRIEASEGSVVYLNSGDWVENLSCLEYDQGAWRIYRYEDDVRLQERAREGSDAPAAFEHPQTHAELLRELMAE